jgi:hypothetical protein
LWVKKEIAFAQSKFPYSPGYEIEDAGPMRFDAVIVEIENSHKSNSIKRVNIIVNL